MSDSGGIPELVHTHPDGRQKNRLEMEQWIREKVPKVHWLRIIASRVYGLPKQVSWDMREIVLKHWLLDEMVRRQQITGDQLGVNQNQSNDEAELRQFTQRLTAFVQAGLAVQPQHAEGVDMTFQPPPPPNMGGAPMPPNGQTQAYPPGPPAPPPPPQGFAPPPMPPGAPQGYGQAQPPQYQPPPVQPPAPPMAGPPGYAPPPAPPGAPMGGPPMGPPPAPPQQQAAAPRRGRGTAAGPPAPPPPAAPVPPMGGPPAPQGFAPAPFPAGPQAPVAPPPGPAVNQFAPLPGSVPAAPQQMSFQMPTGNQPQAPAAAVDLGPVLAAIAELKNVVQAQAKEIAELKKQAQLNNMVVAIVGRAMYQKPGAPDPASFITELGMQLPQ